MANDRKSFQDAQRDEDAPPAARKSETSNGEDSGILDVLSSDGYRILESRAVVAALVDTDTSAEAASLPEQVEVCVEATLQYHDSPRRLFVCRLVEGKCFDNGAKVVPSLQRLKLKSFLESALSQSQPRDGPWLWPVHNRKVSVALMEVQVSGISGFSGDVVPRWRRVLANLYIVLPRHGNAFRDVLMRTHGPGAAYLFARMSFFTHQVWLLVCLAIAYAIIEAALGLDPSQHGVNRTLFEIFKCGVFLWGVMVTIVGRSRSQIGIPEVDPALKICMQKHVQPSPSVADLVSLTTREVHSVQNWCRILAITPVVIFFVALVLVILYAVAVLKVLIIYTWGDCVKRNCKDPMDKHGFWGLCVDMCVDFLLAAVMEITHALTKDLAWWVAAFTKFESVLNYQLSVEMLSVMLISIVKIGTFGIIAFFFVPQWQQPLPPLHESSDTSESADCSDLPFGEHDMFCFARILHIQDRRILFVRLFRGPFIVAPFISIFMKVVVPKLGGLLDYYCGTTRCCCKVCDELVDGFFRIVALVFTRDRGQTGGLTYVCTGWPFTDIHVKSAPQSQENGARRVVVKAPSLRTSVLRTVAAETSAPPSPRDASNMMSPADSPPTLPGAFEPQPLQEVASVEYPAHKVEPDKDGKDVDDPSLYVKGALEQSTWKMFSPMKELLEVKMRFLWVLFFTPMMPVGLIPTLVACIIECRTDLAKMLFVRRIAFAEPDELMHVTQSTFNRAVVCAAIGWYVGLSLLTYNDDLYKWADYQDLVLTLVILWILLSFSFMFCKY